MPRALAAETHTPEEILRRNKQSQDIVENLATIDAIVDSVEAFQRSRQASDSPASTLGVAHETPHRSQTEGTVLRIWKRVLQRDTLDVNMNFFDAGGSSLLLIDVLVSLKNDLGIEFSLVDLFRHATVRQIADAIASAGGASLASDKRPMTQRSDEGWLRQRELWLAARRKIASGRE
jgi:acyl carrier protein